MASLQNTVFFSGSFGVLPDGRLYNWQTVQGQVDWLPATVCSMFAGFFLFLEVMDG